MTSCQNPKCGDRLRPFSKAWLCPSCKYIGRWGIFIGGILVGTAAAILKMAKLI